MMQITFDSMMEKGRKGKKKKEKKEREKERERQGERKKKKHWEKVSVFQKITIENPLLMVIHVCD